MRTPTIILCVLLLAGCVNEDTNYTTIIKGNVLNAGKVSSGIQVTSHDFLTEENFFTEIDSAGNYQVQFDKYYSGEVWFRYDKNFTKVFIHPGETVVFNFDAKSFPDSGFDFLQSEFPNQLSQVKYESIWKDIPYEVYDSVTTHGSFSDYIDFMESEKKRLVSNLQNFIEVNDPPKEFISWAQADIEFHVLNELMRFRWLNPLYNGLNPAKSAAPGFHMDFLNNIDFSDPTFLVSYNYVQFLHEYSGKVLADAQKKDELDLKSANYFQLKDYYCANTEGIIRDLALAKLYGDIINKADWETIDSITPFINTCISFKPAHDLIEKYYETSKYFHFNKEELIRGAEGTSIEALLSNIVLENRGKFIYIDIWSTWCSGCLLAMPTLKKIQAHFENEDVSFVGLNLRSNEMRAKEIISTYNLGGKHYFLSQEQSDDLQVLIGYSGIPRYVLIDREGNFISKDAAAPGDQLKRELQRLLDK